MKVLGFRFEGLSVRRGDLVTPKNIAEILASRTSPPQSKTIRLGDNPAITERILARRAPFNGPICVHPIVEAVVLKPKSPSWLPDSLLEKATLHFTALSVHPLDSLGLSPELQAVLSKHNCERLGDLFDLSSHQLFRLRGVRHFHGDELAGMMARVISNAEGTAITATALAVRNLDAANWIPKPLREKAIELFAELSPIRLDRVALSSRLRGALLRLGCLTLGDVLCLSTQKLFSTKNFGRGSLKELQGVLSNTIQTLSTVNIAGVIKEMK